MKNKNENNLPAVGIFGTLSALVVPVVMLAAIGLVSGLLWNLAMPKLGYPSFSSLEALALWYLYLILICAPFILCVGIWKVMVSPTMPQIYITQVPDNKGVPSTEEIMANLSEALKSVTPPLSSPVDNRPNVSNPSLQDKKKDDNDKDDNDDDFTIPTA